MLAPKIECIHYPHFSSSLHDYLQYSIACLTTGFKANLSLTNPSLFNHVLTLTRGFLSIILSICLTSPGLLTPEDKPPVAGIPGLAAHVVTSNTDTPIGRVSQRTTSNSYSDNHYDLTYQQLTEAFLLFILYYA